MKKGLLEYIIMLILKSKPYYGYELIADINRLAGMDIAEGTIYPLLNRLKKENLLKSEWIEMDVGIPRKYYQLTDEGISQLETMQEYIESINLSITNLNNVKE
jgi:PadR family transcriptional regulator, regulatory protein PadR